MFLEYYRQKRAWLALYQVLFQMQSSYKLLVFLSMDQRWYSVKKHSKSSHLAAEDWQEDSLSVGERGHAGLGLIICFMTHEVLKLCQVILSPQPPKYRNCRLKIVLNVV